MPLDEQVKAEPCAGSLSVCLVDGNAEQNARERKIKRRALILSVSVQTIGLTALAIAPMLAKPAELAMRTIPPVPIYTSRPTHPHTVHSRAPRPNPGWCLTCPINSKPQIQRTEATTRSGTEEAPIVETSDGPGATFAIAESRPQPPHEAESTHVTQVVHRTQVDPAMLLRRIEPIYPPIAKQTRQSGKVELHALIGTDGLIQSLEVVSGNPLLVKSALDAVKQWRYRPTYLNGQAVEVDTYITVIYSLQ